MELRPHDLVRLTEASALIDAATPDWVPAALAAAPWAVVRRCRAEAGRLAVGIRGATRAERFAMTVPVSAVAAVVTPEDLARDRAWWRAARQEAMPALAALPAVADAIEPVQLAWGPTGGVGFELATGLPVLTDGSDLDLVVRVEAIPADPARLSALAARLGSVPGRIDAQIETSAGSMALAEIVRGEGSLLLRTAEGPRLVQPAAAA